MGSELKPCPFCGCQASAVETARYWLRCDGCGAEGPNAETEAEAVEVWNRRSEPRGDSPLAPEGAPQLGSTQLSSQREASSAPLAEAQIDHMVSRFLGWRLPEDFNPDCGISFQREHSHEYMASLGKPPMKFEPNGTSLFGADQARQMVLYMLAGLPR